jgi:branched-chain amino acid transport system ATP-binding protein
MTGMSGDDRPKPAFLEVADLVSGYAGSRVLDCVSLQVSAGESVALLGRNGVGKTTLVETIMGLVRRAEGTVVVEGKDLTSAPAHVMARAGLAIVPQGRRVFAPLTVEENLQVAGRGKRRAAHETWTPERVYDLMPRLAERRTHLGSQLSGGEQQMLSIGRALLCNPRLVLLDEPSDGLAPAVVEQVATVLRTLLSEGLALLVVEQDLRLAFDVADRVLVMAKGTLVHSATVADFRADGARARRLLGIG